MVNGTLTAPARDREEEKLIAKQLAMIEAEH